MAGGSIPHFQNDAGHRGDRHRRQGIHVRRRQPALRPSACLPRHGRRQREGLPLLLDALSLYARAEGDRNAPGRLPLPRPGGLTARTSADGRHGASRQIIIAGGGIAGLTAALAFARARLSGAALRARPTARRDRRRPPAFAQRHAHPATELGVARRRCASVAVRPDAVVLRDAREPAATGARTARRFRRTALGRALSRRASRRPAKRAARARRASEPEIQLVTGAAVRDFALHARRRHRFDRSRRQDRRSDGPLLVGADGVWSEPARAGRRQGKSRFSGQHRLARDRARPKAGRQLARRDRAAQRVTAFLHPAFHLIVYPLRGGDASTSSPSPQASAWARAGRARPTPQLLEALQRRGAPATAGSWSRRSASWTVWPIHTVAFDGPWTLGGGVRADRRRRPRDDAVCGARRGDGDRGRRDAGRHRRRLGRERCRSAGSLGGGAAAARSSRVVRRGALNRFAWHASGPVALARNLFLRTRSPERLAADLDWLYGWRSAGELAGSVVRVLKRIDQRLRQRVPPAGPAGPPRAGRGRPGVAADERGERAVRLEEACRTRRSRCPRDRIGAPLGLGKARAR